MPSPQMQAKRPMAAYDAGRHECDFCGQEVSAVSRVALDQEYDRLQKAHRALYSCASCFDSKEEKRLGLGARR